MPAKICWRWKIKCKVYDCKGQEQQAFEFESVSKRFSAVMGKAFTSKRIVPGAAGWDISVHVERHPSEVA
jgi:hypothetical protein